MPRSVETRLHVWPRQGVPPQPTLRPEGLADCGTRPFAAKARRPRDHRGGLNGLSKGLKVLIATNVRGKAAGSLSGTQSDKKHQGAVSWGGAYLFCFDLFRFGSAQPTQRRVWK